MAAEILQFRIVSRNYAESDRMADLAELQKEPKPLYSEKRNNLLAGTAILVCVVIIAYAAWVRV